MRWDLIYVWRYLGGENDTEALDECDDDEYPEWMRDEGSGVYVERNFPIPHF